MKMPWLLIALLAPTTGLRADELRIGGRSAQSTRASLSLMHHPLDPSQQIAQANALLHIPLADVDRTPPSVDADAMEVPRPRIDGLSHRQIVPLGDHLPARIEAITRHATDARP